MTERLDPKTFADPPGTFRPIPFWFWNGDMQEAEIDRQLREMRDKGVMEAFIHARKGLEIPYLSETWFDRVGFTVKKAAEYGMRMWLYDEDNWPSGYAGGRVVKADPNCKLKNLERVTVESGAKKVDSFVERYGVWTAAYTEDSYVDLLNPATVKEFIRVTHEEYYRRFGDEFGKAIAGIFTDEPGFYTNLWGKDADMITWTGDFLKEFQAAKGYDLTPHLISIWEDVGDYRRIRADYFDILSALFRDVYFKELHDWCVEHGIESIGHVTIEEDLTHNARMFGDFFRSMEYLTIPGIDEIGQMRADPDVITPKLGSSSAHVFGRERCMSETFGVYEWHLTMEEMKHTTDWQYVRGVNYFVPHAFYYSIEGERKDECPPSEFWQNIWWKYFKHYADYVGRLSYMNTRGHHVADVAIYYPITSVWAEITPTDTAKPDALDARFKEVSSLLLANHRDFDYINDDAIRDATVKNGKLKINHEDYGIFVIPAATVMAVDVMEKLAKFCRSGGILIIVGDLPEYAVINGTDDELAKALDSLAGKYFHVQTAEEILPALNSSYSPDVMLEPVESTINYLHRRDGNTDIYFLANRSPEQRVFTAKFRSTSIPAFWNAEDGTISDVAEYSQWDGYTVVPIEMSGYGSTYIVFSPSEDRPHVVGTNLPTVLEATEQSVRGTVRRSGSYYADVAMGDRVTRRGATVLNVPAPIELGNGWSYRTEGESESKPTKLGSWTDQGLPEYSGSAVYSISFDLDARYTDRPLLLDLGTVRETAEIRVNGQPAGVRLWRPYTLDIGPLVHEGANQLEVVVTNTLANRFRNNPLESGLLGPIKLLPMEEVVLE